jgi:hypothetical protein
MKYIPYYFTKKQIQAKSGKFTLITINALLENGTNLWEDEVVSVKELCEVNDIVHVPAATKATADETWIQVDTQRTVLSDFFTYEEAMNQDPSLAEGGALLWRGWRLLLDKSNTPVFSPKDMPPRLVAVAQHAITAV